MILPIVAYGDPVLKKTAIEIDQSYPDLLLLIDNMFETMYKAKGVGLAAPQIGKSIRLFIVDGSPFADEEGDEPDPRAEGIVDFKKVFIVFVFTIGWKSNFCFYVTLSGVEGLFFF